MKNNKDTESDYLRETVGKNIKSFRKNRGFTQDDLATLINNQTHDGAAAIEGNTISKYERGVRMPGQKNRGLIARALGVEEQDLFEDSDEEKACACNARIYMHHYIDTLDDDVVLGLWCFCSKR